MAAASRVAPLFIENEMAAEVVLLPEGLDPDLFIRQNGRESFIEKMGHGTPILSFAILQAARLTPSSIAEKTKAVYALFPLIQKITHQVEQGHYLKEIADAFGVEEKDVRIDFEKGKRLEKGLAVSVPPPVVPVLKSRLPEDEETLLALLVQDQLDRALLAPLFPHDFMTPTAQVIVRCFWDTERESWMRPNSLSVKDASEQMFFSELAVLEIPSENRQQLTLDCILSLQKKRLLRNTRQIQGELKSAEKGGDRQKALSLQQTFFRLKKELSQIGSAHLHG
jgi:DNA primase